MRLITNKLEYVITCMCGTKIGYVMAEANNKIVMCPHCKLHHTLNGKHDLYHLEKVNVHYQTEQKELT